MTALALSGAIGNGVSNAEVTKRRASKSPVSTPRLYPSKFVSCEHYSYSFLCGESGERMLANHPSLKPQAFLRQIVHAAIPLGQGILADPFMGSGSTIAAAEAVGISAMGAERYKSYYDEARQAIPKLREIGECTKGTHR